MDYYPLYLLDRARHRDILPARIEDLETAAQVIDRLRDLEPGPNPRFERLGWHLERLFPFGEYSLTVDSTEEEIEACLDMDPIWICNSPKDELSRWGAALWTPEVYPNRLPELMENLVTLARLLRLDLYDEAQGIYLPATSLAVPTGAGDEYRLLYDPGAINPTRFSADSLRALMMERLNQALGGLGFRHLPDTHYDFYFRRPIEGGEQIIWGLIRGSAPALSCEFKLLSRSNRMAEFRRDIYEPGVTHPGWDSDVFEIYLRDIRELAHPGWESFAVGSASYTFNEEDVDWMVADLLSLGMPILEKAKTVAGVDWLFNSEAAAKTFPGNLHAPYVYVPDSAEPALIYARLAGNPRFDAIVAEVEERTREASAPFLERYPRLLGLCRNSLGPLPSTVA